MKSSLTQYFRTCTPTYLRRRLSRDDWTLCTLMVGYLSALCLFTGVMLLLGGCALKDGGYADVGIKTTITPAPAPKGLPPTEPLQKKSPEQP